MLAAADESGTIALDDRRRRRWGGSARCGSPAPRPFGREAGTDRPDAHRRCGVAPGLRQGADCSRPLYDGGNPRRSFGDVDLVVPRERLDDARPALADAGWVEDLEFAPGFAARFGHELHQRRRRGGMALASCTRGSATIPCARGSTTGCSPRGDSPGAPPRRASRRIPAELLLLCVHFLDDGERRLISIDDIRRAAERADAGHGSSSFRWLERRLPGAAPRPRLRQALRGLHRSGQLPLDRPRPSARCAGDRGARDARSRCTSVAWRCQGLDKAGPTPTCGPC